MKRFLSTTYLVLILVMLYAPIIIIAIFSFTESRVLGNWTGFSTELYESLFSGGVNNSLIDAIQNTFIIGSLLLVPLFKLGKQVLVDVVAPVIYFEYLLTLLAPASYA